jgi:hypothetical protein
MIESEIRDEFARVTAELDQLEAGLAEDRRVLAEVRSQEPGPEGDRRFYAALRQANEARDVD